VYVGVDVHKASWHATALVDGEVIFSGGIFPVYRALKDLLARFEECEILVAYEAGPCGFGLYDHLERDHYRCIVAAPSLIPVQSGNRVKTDRRDSRKLAELLASGMLKAVHVLSEEQRAHRDLLRTRRQLVEHRSSAMRQIKAKLLFFSLSLPEGDARSWSRAFRNMLREMDYPHPELRASVRSLLNTYEFLGLEIVSLTKDAIALSRTQGYKEPVEILLTVPGIGRITAMEILTELGDVTRFACNESISSFVGLTPSEYSSGEQTRQGRITRCGNKRVRTALIESSWALIRKDVEMKRKFQRIARRRGSKRAITAVARNLAGRIRTILLRKESYAVTVE
jgi:transposase